MSPLRELNFVDLSNIVAEKLDSTTVDIKNISGRGCVLPARRRARDPDPGAELRAGREARPDAERLRLPAVALEGGRGGHATHRPRQRAAALAVRNHSPARPPGGS